MANIGQRVGIFVDVQNLYYSAKNLYQSYVNFSQILKKGLGSGQLVRAVAYGIKANLPKEEVFFKALAEAGFELKLKDLQVYAGGLKKGNWDVGMSVDMIRLAEKLDIVVLASGDGDFLDLVEYLQNRGIYVKIFAFGQSASTKLIERADFFEDLDKNTDSFLIKK